MNVSSAPAISSVGTAATRLQVSVHVIESAASKLKIETALMLNGIRHLADSDIERIRQFLNSVSLAPSTK